MTYRSILVHVEPGDVGAARLDCAAAVADRYDALLIGVGAELMQSAAVADPYGMMAMDWQVLLQQQVERDLAAAQVRFEAFAGKRRHEWRACSGAPIEALCQAARSADLIVAGGDRPERHDPYRTTDTAQLVLRAGRPVLVAPPTPSTFRGDRVLVAWKDTREARRALADAMPFLARAEAVVVMEVCQKSGLAYAEAHTSDVVAHLARHGIVASAKVELACDDRACTELHIQAQGMAADLIVAGGYGHSRLQEWVLGGVTRGLLRHPERYVLLSH